MFSKVKLSENVDTLLLTPSVFSNFTSILENSDIVSFISFKLDPKPSATSMSIATSTAKIAKISSSRSHS